MTRLIGIPLGWIMWLMYQITQNYALAIVLFTLIAKILLFPLSVKQQKSSAAMSAFTPKLEQLKKQYGNNQQKLQEEQMKLYAEEGINPMASCLPLFIQFPLLIGIFDVVYRPISHIIRASSDVINQAAEICKEIFTADGGTVPAYFSGRPEIYIVKEIQYAQEHHTGAFDALDPEFVNAVANFNNKLFGKVDLGDIPTLHPEKWDAAAVILLIIPILSGLIQLFMTVYSQIRSKRMNPDAPSMGSMNIMLYGMPLFSVYIAFRYPAGIGFYWTISSLFSLVQSMILYRIYTPEYVAELVEKDKQKRKKKNRPDLMARYQKMLEEQQAAQNGGKGGSETRSGGSGAVAAAVSDDDDEGTTEVKLSKAKQKEYERMLIREARRRQAEKYGEEFIDDDED